MEINKEELLNNLLENSKKDQVRTSNSYEGGLIVGFYNGFDKAEKHYLKIIEEKDKFINLIQERKKEIKK